VKWHSPLMHEIRLQMFGSLDSLQKSVVSFERRGLHLLTLNTCLKFWGLPRKRGAFVETKEYSLKCITLHEMADNAARPLTISMQKSPVFPPNSPIFLQKYHSSGGRAYNFIKHIRASIATSMQKSPLFSKELCIPGQKNSTFPPQSSVFSQKSPVFLQKSPEFPHKSPIFHRAHTRVLSQCPCQNALYFCKEPCNILCS